MLSELGWSEVKPRIETDNRLCLRCSNVASESLFGSTRSLSLLKQSSEDCELCTFLLRELRRRNVELDEVISISQYKGIISVDGGPSLLSVYHDPREFVLVFLYSRL